MSHRAGGNEAPENTLAALRSAEEAGSRVMLLFREKETLHDCFDALDKENRSP